MNDLQKYSCLSSLTKGLATEFWVENIKKTSGCGTVYKLEEYFEKKGLDDLAAKKSKFWYNKQKGEPVLRKNKILDIENLTIFQGTTKHLTHPFWRLIDNKNITLEFLQEIIIELPAKTTNGVMFYNNEQGIYSLKSNITCNQINRISRETSLNALTCLLILFRLKQITNKYVNLNNLEFSAFQMLIRLFTYGALSTIKHKKHLYNKVYLYVVSLKDSEQKTLLNEYSRSLIDESGSLFTIPAFFLHISKLNIRKLTRFYFQIIELVIEIKLIKNSFRHKLAFYHLCSNCDPAWLKINIDYIKQHHTPSPFKDILSPLLKKFESTIHLYP